jgi:hypothetical protein
VLKVESARYFLYSIAIENNDMMTIELGHGNILAAVLIILGN